MTSAESDSNAELIKTAEQFLEAARHFNGDSTERMGLLKNIDKLRVLVETPMDSVMHFWEANNIIAAVNLLTETGTMEKLPADGSAITAKELGEMANLDESVVARSFRLAVMSGIATETAPSTFAHNEKSRAYLPGYAGEFWWTCIDIFRSELQLPSYFKTHTQADLYDLKKSPFAYSVGLEGQTYYEALSHDPIRINAFNKVFAQMEKQFPFHDMFPFASLKVQVEADKSRAFVVDIGGGRGQSLLDIQKVAPGGFGAKMILQDRKVVLDALTEADIPGIEKMPYDLFTPQPVKHAHVYLIRRVLHDFYPPVCITILKIIAAAMSPTSRLIIADMIMPERTEVGTELTPYWMDFSMMILNGEEKSEKGFERIVEAAGLEIVKIWKFRFGTQAQIECRLKTVRDGSF